MAQEVDFEWKQLGNCFRFGPTSPEDDYWFDAYEKSKEVAKNVDQMCFTCPVQGICLNYGLNEKMDGVWGGAYLQNGKIVESKNRHKTEEQWRIIESLL